MDMQIKQSNGMGNKSNNGNIEKNYRDILKCMWRFRTGNVRSRKVLIEPARLTFCISVFFPNGNEK